MAATKIGIVGAGRIGGNLATQWARRGHDVLLADAARLAEELEEGGERRPSGPRVLPRPWLRSRVPGVRRPPLDHGLPRSAAVRFLRSNAQHTGHHLKYAP